MGDQGDGGPAIERLRRTMINLAGLDQIVALAPANVDGVPLVFHRVRSRRWSASPRCAQIFLTQSLVRPVG